MSRLFDAESDRGGGAQVRDARVPLIGMKRANVPVTLSRVVHRALERDPTRRFKSAREMLSSASRPLEGAARYH